MLKPSAIGAVLMLMMLGGCGEGRVSSAHFADPQAGVDVEYTLVGAHVYLAEFHRTLRVTFGDARAELPLAMDTGGYLLMDIYRLPDDRLLLSDSEECVIIDPCRKTVEPAAGIPEDVSPEYLGCFDSPGGAALQFIPAASRPNQRPLHCDDPRPKASNQAMQRTASKPAIYALSVCHPRLGCGSRLTGLAVADLGSR